MWPLPETETEMYNGYWGFTNKACNKLGGDFYSEGATPKVNIPLYWSCGLSKNMGYWINDMQNAPPQGMNMRKGLNNDKPTKPTDRREANDES